MGKHYLTFWRQSLLALICLALFACTQKTNLSGLISEGQSSGASTSSPAGPSSSPVPVVTAGTRDPKKWPFAADSIWNMPIGSNAVYASANLDVDGLNLGANGEAAQLGWVTMPAIDQNIIVMHPEANPIPLLHTNMPNINWGGDRCATTDNVTLNPGIPWPSNYFAPSDNGNDSTAVLLKDNTILQFQPGTRCTGATAGYVTALLLMPTNTLSITGPGIEGAHGGSMLSALGGTLRVGELVSGPPRHALAMFTGTSDKHFCRTDGKCYRWPAYSSTWDANGNGTPTYYCNGKSQNLPCQGSEQWLYGVNDKTPSAAEALVTGALLAINSNVDINSLKLQTQPGKWIAQTLQDYGAYVNDSAGGQSDVGFDTEQGPDGNFATNFKAQWGYSFWGWAIDRGTPQYGNQYGTNPFLQDMRVILSVLQVVTNNGPKNIGGGGIPRQPLAPPFQGASSSVAAPPNPLRIMPLGDSITFGYGSGSNTKYSGYRYPLYQLLTKPNFNVQFIGSMTSQPTGSAAQPYYPNEGHFGWTVENLISNPISNNNGSYNPTLPSQGVDEYLTYSAPDLILLMAGTNDIFQTSNLKGSAGALDTIIRSAHRDRPNAKIIVAKIPPMAQTLQAGYGSPGAPNNTYIKTYNDLIPGLVSAEQADGIPVTLVDMNSALDPTTDLNTDGVHPNDSGYSKMATVWYNGIKTIFQLP